MVFTRGHKQDGDDKISLPQRECRRSNRGTLQEPEDDIIWESDEQSSNKPQRNIKQDNCNFKNQHQKRRNSGHLVKLEMEEDNEIDVQSERVSTQSNDMEGESDTDGELFIQKKTSHSQNFPCDIRRSSRDRRCPNKEGFTLNLDDIEITDEKSDNENGLRRSLRKKAFKSSQSWLVGPKTLRGYPNIINSSEPEHDEPRAAQKSIRYNRVTSKNTRDQRRSNKYHQVRERSSRYLHSGRSHSIAKTRRITRYSQDFHEGDAEDEGVEDDEECKTERKDDKDLSPSASQTDKSNKQLYSSRPKRHRAIKVQYDEDSNTDENIYTGRYHSRRRWSSGRLRSTRSARHLKEEQMTESENSGKDEKDEHEEDDEEAKQDKNDAKKIKRTREPILNDLKNGSSPCEVPSKRMRKPVSRLTYEVTTNHRKKVSSFASSSSSESSDDDDTRQSVSQGRSRYPLRQNRKKLNSFESIPSHRHKHESALSAYLHSPARKPVFSRKHKATHTRDDTSSSSDEKGFEKRKAKSMAKARNNCYPINMKPEDIQLSGLRDHKVGNSLADIDPMSMDTSINFDSIGGLTQHIKSLKEMILFPIMYPEVFQKFGVNPPRGVLFYGPPGTGKTLVARALANECSHDDRKIAFFMRKGADCLSKWVGESERQLRLLFDQAYQMRPSIIFFDEIDGLAPVRSSRQDQIHSSIVSTLLALLDGVDSRGEIVVIGATNRIDAIDPALRRPGRFDREFLFPLPSIEARKQILKIHTKKWEPKPTPALLKYLSEQTVGYCGADLKSLCGESALVALRNKYPQIYTSKKKLLLDTSSIQIKCKHFKHCLTKIIPAGQRATNAPGRKLSVVLEPLMKGSLESSLTLLKGCFPQGFQKNVYNRVLHRPRLLLVGEKNQGQTSLLGPAILHSLERIPTHRLDFPSLFSVAARAPEEACAQIFHEAKRNVPGILYVPLIDHLWKAAGDSVKSTFLYLLNDLESTVPVMLLATVENQYATLDPEIKEIFSVFREEIFVMSNPSIEQRYEFFHPIFYKKIISKPSTQNKNRTIMALPLAPPPVPREMKPEEVQKLEDVEEASLRELRIFLRQICAKLAKNKMFYIFTKPVDLEEVQDYLQYISKPMDLETMMTKIDLHHYECAQDFLTDVEQIVTNALEYNPDRNPEDKLIRHRACTLRDTAYAYIKAEMDTDFEEKCRDIRRNRRKRKRTHLKLPPHFLQISQTLQDSNIITSRENGEAKINQEQEEVDENRPTSIVTSNKKRKRRSNWSRGMVTSKKKKIDKDKCEEQKEILDETEDNRDQEETEEGNADSTGRVEECDMEEEKSETSQSKRNDSDGVLLNGNISTEDSSQGSNKVTSAFDSFYSQCITDSIAEETAVLKVQSETCEQACDTAVSSSEQGGPLPNIDREICVDLARLDSLYSSCVSSTDNSTIEELHHLYSILSAMCIKHQSCSDRNQLLSEIESEIERFVQYRREFGSMETE